MARFSASKARLRAEWRAVEEEQGPGWADGGIGVCNDMPRWIYGLEDPRTHTLHWIGQTADIDNRLDSHVEAARYRTSREFKHPKSVWIRSVFSDGLHPRVCGFEEVAWRIVFDVENAYIACALGLGCPLLNQRVPASFKTDLSETWQAQIRARIEKFI